MDLAGVSEPHPVLFVAPEERERKRESEKERERESARERERVCVR